METSLPSSPFPPTQPGFLKGKLKVPLPASLPLTPSPTPLLKPCRPGGSSLKFSASETPSSPMLDSFVCWALSGPWLVFSHLGKCRCPGFLLSQDYFPYQQPRTLRACWGLQSTRPKHSRDPLPLVPPPCCLSKSLSQKPWLLSVSIDETVQGSHSSRTCVLTGGQTTDHRLHEGVENCEGWARERQRVGRGHHWTDEAPSG